MAHESCMRITVQQISLPKIILMAVLGGGGTTVDGNRQAFEDSLAELIVF